MSRARRALHRQRRPLVLAVGAAAAVAVVATGVAIAQLGSPDKPATQPTQSASHSQHSANPSAAGASPATASAPAQQRVSSTADTCAAEVRATEAVVAAARTAAGHWREHVQARTDLLSGKNSEAATKAIWKRTRLAGPGDIAALNTAVVAQTAAVGACAKLSGSAAANCKQRLSVFGRAATADRAAAADWANHLAMMAAHAAGDFDAAHAQEMWVSAWSAAPKNLTAATRAEAELSTAAVCRPA